MIQFLKGMGFGIVLPVSFTFFNQYFVERRVFAIGLGKTLQSLIKTVCPMIIHYSMENYGFRGMLLIVSGIHAHFIAGMLLMQPVEKHYKEILVPIDESEESMISKEKDHVLQTTLISESVCKDDQEIKEIESTPPSKKGIWYSNHNHQFSKQFAQHILILI